MLTRIPFRITLLPCQNDSDNGPFAVFGPGLEWTQRAVKHHEPGLVRLLATLAEKIVLKVPHSVPGT